MSDPLSPSIPHPPIEQGELDREPPRTRWPIVFGVIGLLLAICGLLCNGMFLTWIGLGNALPEMYRGGVEMPPIVRVTGAVTCILALIFAVMLLIGSIGLLRRRRSAPSLLRKWVVLSLLLLLISTVLTFVTMPAQIEMARSSERYMTRVMPTAVKPKTDEQHWFAITIQTGIFTAVWAAFPIVLGAWLSRRRIVHEVATWE
jgi:hypothetical protein